MPKVHILPPDVISKIAAGEVIDRPASVIKELMENSLDAGTKSLEIVLKDAGKQSLIVRDSGHGIEEDDLSEIFHRHATSKISSADDLFDIRSLGFRGEALYSIAAISDVTVKSRSQEQDAGWEVHVRGGEELDRRPTPMDIGTEIEIRELFYNTPARKKFLKTNTTEMNQILNVFVPYNLLYPDIHFTLTHGDRTIIDCKPSPELKDRIADSLNFSAEHLIETERDYPEEHLSIKLVMGDINITRSRRDLQFIFINGRPVMNKSISYHLNDIARLMFPPAHFPFFAVYITLPANQLDVNIHPTKREVKIKHEQSVCSLLRHLAENMLMQDGGIKQASYEQPDFKPSGEDVQKAFQQTNRIEKAFDGTLSADIFEPSVAEPSHTEQHTFPNTQPLSMAGDSLFQKQTDSLRAKIERARYIGPLMNKFLLFEIDRSLLVFDQHAAQERITYEMLILQLDRGKVEVQQLLTPYTLQMTSLELLIWEETKDRLNEVGFETTLFDDQTVAIHTYPALLQSPDKAVRDILAGDNPARCDFAALANRACKSSIRAGDTMNREQAENQRDQLLNCQDPFTCPHGRPTVIEMTEGFLDKQFLRT